MSLVTEKSNSSHLEGSLEESSEVSKYLVFGIGPDLFATKLLDIREVVEALTTKTIPNTIKAFRGVCNLRGQIIGVIDLRERFSIIDAQQHRQVYLIFDTGSGALAAVVDRIVSVVQIEDDQIARKTNIVSVVPQKYLIGVAEHGQRLLTLLDLKLVLSHEELVQLTDSKLQAKLG